MLFSHVMRHLAGNYFGVHGAAADQRSGAEGEIAELLIDLSAVLAVEVLPYEIARLGDIGHILGPALWVGKIFGSDSKILGVVIDRKSTRLNSSHLGISYAVFCLKKK